MRKILHKKRWRTGVLQIHVEPLLIPLIKSNIDKKTGKNMLKLNYVEVLRHKIWNSMNLKWPCLLMVIWRSSRCFCET